MEVRTALVTDSTCNLPASLAAERHIYMAPLYVIWKDETFKDGVELTEAEFFTRLENSDEIPKTSQVSPQDFVTLFETARQAEQADAVVCAVLSSDLSGTYASALQAKEMVDFPVHVVDTKQTSWALGFPMLAAAAARDEGAGAVEIAAAIRDAAQRQRLIFTIESLEYLHRGGRIGNARLLLGSALNIKPLLELRDGVVSSVDNVRTRKRAVDHLLTVAEDRVGENPVSRVAVIHGDTEDEGFVLLEKIVQKFQPKESYISYATSVLGVHVGPGALGVIVEWCG